MQIKHIVIACIFMILIVSCQQSAMPNKLGLSGQAEMALEITESMLYKLNIANKGITSGQNPPFSHIKIRAEDSNNLIRLTAANLNKDILVGGESTEALLHFTGDKAGSTKVLLYVDSDQGSSQPLPIQVTVTKPDLSISFGGLFTNNCVAIGKRESKDVKVKMMTENPIRVKLS